MMWAKTIVVKPRLMPMLAKPCTKIVSSAAPITISGVAIGTKISTLLAALPRKR